MSVKDKGNATESQLGALHGGVARVMTGALKRIELLNQVCNEAIEAVEFSTEEDRTEFFEMVNKLPDVNASLLSVITKFLNDNNISVAPEENNDVSTLAQHLRQKKENARQRGTRRAVGNVVHMHDE